MAKVHRLEGKVEIECHADKFFEAFVYQPAELVTKACPHLYSKIELNEGAWHADGSKSTWSYILDGGESESVEVITKKIDVESKSVWYEIADGQMMNYFKSFKSKMEVTPKGERSIVKWSFEYEKMDEDGPDPNENLDVMLNCAKGLGTYLRAA